MASGWWRQNGGPPFDDEWDGPPEEAGDGSTGQGEWHEGTDRHHHHHHHPDPRFCCPPGCSRAVYVVRLGDTLAAILQRFAVTVGMLGCCNPCVDLCFLRPGTALCIPNQVCFPRMKHITTCHFPSRAH